MLSPEGQDFRMSPGSLCVIVRHLPGHHIQRPFRSHEFVRELLGSGNSTLLHICPGRHVSTMHSLSPGAPHSKDAAYRAASMCEQMYIGLCRVGPGRLASHVALPLPAGGPL